MFVAMNNFKVVADRTADFERTWQERESHLQEALIVETPEGRAVPTS